MNRFAKNGTANFSRASPTEITGPPPEVIQNNPVARNRNEPFHLTYDRHFRNLCIDIIENTRGLHVLVHCSSEVMESFPLILVQSAPLEWFWGLPVTKALWG